MKKWTTTTIADGEDTIVVFPDDLAAELGWGPGTDVKIWKDGEVIYVRPIKKRARKAVSA